MTYKFDDMIGLSGSKLLAIVFIAGVLFSLAPLSNIVHAALPMCGSGGGCNPGSCPSGESCQPITGTTGCGASMNMPHVRCQSSASMTISPNPVTVGSSATIKVTCATGTDACSVDSPLGTHQCESTGGCTYTTPTTLGVGSYTYYGNDITTDSYMVGVLTVKSASPPITLTITPTSGTSPTSVTFSATCTAGSCDGPTNIYDYGTAGCPQNPPGTNPAACNYGDISTMTTPCTISHSGGTKTTAGPESVSSSSGSPVTHNICAFGQSTAGWQATTATLTINPSGGSTGTGSGTANGVVGAICNVYYIVNTIVFVLALTLMILGGALYAGAQILPGSSRGTVQGYAMGLVFGGVVGAIIAVLAPYILSIVYGNTVAGILTICAP